MKRLFLGALTALSLALAPAAYSKTLNTLLINRVDGKQDKLKLHESLQIVPSEEGDILLIHPSVTCIYPLADVKSMTMTNNTAMTTDYEGDYELKDEDSIAETTAGVTISIAPGAITVSGCSEAITLHAANGIETGRWNVAPSVRISTSSLLPGVYILRAGATTLKVRI